jgi:hypothetical protein
MCIYINMRDKSKRISDRRYEYKVSSYELQEICCYMKMVEFHNELRAEKV